MFSFGISTGAALTISVAWFSVSGRRLKDYLTKAGLAILLLIVVGFILSLIPMGGEEIGGTIFAVFVFFAGIFLLVGLNCFNMLMFFLE